MKKDSTFKIIGVAALTIIVLWFLKAMLFPIGYGMSVSYRIPGHMGDGYIYSNGFNSLAASGTILLTFIIKVLLIIFVIGLLIGLLIAIKNHVFTQEDIITIKDTFAGKPEKHSVVCSECGKNLDEEWKVCPYCGKEIDKP